MTFPASISKCFLALLLAITTSLSIAQLQPAKVFSDQMVLQRNIDIPVWGTADPGTEVVVTFNDHPVTTMANKNGKWEVKLPEMKAGGPYTMTISDSKESVQFEDVLIGDVWVASGQSNMEWQVQQSMNAPEEIEKADYQKIRFFNVPHAKKVEEQVDLKGGNWQVCNPGSIKDKSAVAYFFARKIHTEENVPIGILQSTWGGTPVEAWTSREMLLSSPITQQGVLNNDTLTDAAFKQDSLNNARFWDIVYQVKNEADEKYTTPKFDDSDWNEVNMPSIIENWDIYPYEGIIWARKNIDIPKSMVGKPLTIHLGLLEMNYSLYFNGKEICKTVWNASETHHYTIPEGVVKKGNNVISVRFAALWGGGGFNTTTENMYITNGTHKVSIAGTWKYKKDLEPEIPTIKNYHKYPTYLYNGMINPIIPYGIKGFLWYQGEDNVTAPADYHTLFSMMINDWRIRWKQGYLPFLFVQLANYLEHKEQPGESQWAELREAQMMTTSLPNTGMACIIDLGEADDIHPTNKQDVGKRLALIAQQQVYGKDVQSSGPVFDGYTIAGSEIRIHFTETGAGLDTRKGEKVKGFAIAGEDHKFYWADARIEGDDVIVSSSGVEKPVAVRYGWADNPDCNLINKDGLPAVPFRTD